MTLQPLPSPRPPGRKVPTAKQQPAQVPSTTEGTACHVVLGCLWGGTCLLPLWTGHRRPPSLSTMGNSPIPQRLAGCGCSTIWVQTLFSRPRSPDACSDSSHHPSEVQAVANMERRDPGSQFSSAHPPAGTPWFLPKKDFRLPPKDPGGAVSQAPFWIFRNMVTGGQMTDPASREALAEGLLRQTPVQRAHPAQPLLGVTRRLCVGS